MDKKAREEVLQELATIRKLAGKVREQSGIPVIESCARWCETYARIAQWSLGEGERFDFMLHRKEALTGSAETTGARGGEQALWHETMEANTLAVKVKFMGDLRAIVGRRETTKELPVGSTVKDLVASLSDDFGELFSSRVLNRRGNLEHYVLVFLNGKNIKEMKGLETTLGEGEVEILMLPMFEGG